MGGHRAILGQVKRGWADEVALVPAQAGSNGFNLVSRCLSAGGKDAGQCTVRLPAGGECLGWTQVQEKRWNGRDSGREGARLR